MEIFQNRLPWYFAGPLLAVIVVSLQWAANLPLGATGAIASLPSWSRGRQERGDTWRLFFFAGMILGGFFFALASGGFHPSFESGPVKAWLLPIAGLLIGFGARKAGGCTSGNGICGFSRGSRGSMVATLVFVICAIVTANLIRWVFYG